jgi:hypothetical protein
MLAVFFLQEHGAAPFDRRLLSKSALPVGHVLRLDRLLPELANSVVRTEANDDAHRQAAAHLRNVRATVRRAVHYWRDTFEWDYSSLETISQLADFARNAYIDGVMAVGFVRGLDRATLRQRLFEEGQQERVSDRFMKTATRRGPDNFTLDLEVFSADVERLGRASA